MTLDGLGGKEHPFDRRQGQMAVMFTGLANLPGNIAMVFMAIQAGKQSGLHSCEQFVAIYDDSCASKLQSLFEQIKTQRLDETRWRL